MPRHRSDFSHPPQAQHQAVGRSRPSRLHLRGTYFIVNGNLHENFNEANAVFLDASGFGGLELEGRVQLHGSRLVRNGAKDVRKKLLALLRFIAAVGSRFSID